MTTKEEFFELLKDEILSLVKINFKKKLNKVFQYTLKTPLTSINDLSNEFILKSLILEM